jgi:hypothetical protein
MLFSHTGQERADSNEVRGFKDPEEDDEVLVY